MRLNVNNNISDAGRGRKIHLVLLGLGVLLQPTFSTAADFQGQLKGVTITDASGVNAPPKAQITYTQSGNVYTFDASGSTDLDGTITQYKWDFGDGNTATTAVAQHQFATPGDTANVTLNIVDDKGAVALAQVSFAMPVVYEDAEDGTISRWTIYDYDPAGAVITNVYDDVRKSRVIDFKGSDLSNGYKLLKSGGVVWSNTQNFVIQWSFNYINSYDIYIDCQTSVGRRYLRYTSTATSALGTGEYVQYGLGTATRNGQWQTITRDLVADLKEAQPSVQLIAVNAFLIRGTGRVDDIVLKK